MPLLLSEGAVLACSFGTAPMAMIVPPETPVLANAMPTAAILAFVPEENIPSFGLCSSLANPEVAEATAAAEGVLTPMPCVPATTTPWKPGALRVKTNELAILCAGSICTCDWLGEITIDEPGQGSVTVM